MTACGDTDDCISTTEAQEMAAKLEEDEIRNLPRPGQVDFINGGPPCQVLISNLKLLNFQTSYKYKIQNMVIDH